MTTESIRYEDRNGSVVVRRSHKILHAEFSGACSAKIARAFYNACVQFIPEFKGATWGYLSDSISYDAATPEAESIFEQAYTFCLKHGCVAEAYCNNSPVGRAQIARIRSACGIAGDMQSITFATPAEAKASLEEKLEKLDNPTV